MTTGSSSVGSAYSSFYHTKSWSGTDGKYEFIGTPSERLKWNNFTAEEFVESQTSETSTWTSGSGCPLTYPGYYAQYNDTLTRLIQEIQGHKLNLAMDIAEGKEAGIMVMNTIKGIGKIAEDVRHKDLASAARRLTALYSHNPATYVYRPPRNFLKAMERTTSDVGNTWLAIQYGMKPLLGSIFESVNLYNTRMAERRRAIVKVSTRVRDWYDGSASPLNWTCKGPFIGRIHITYEMEEQFPLPLMTELGFHDPATIAWELIPASFVADWFLPVGQYLELINKIPKLQGRFRVTRTLRHEYNGYVVNPVWVASHGQTYSSGEQRRIERVVSSSLGGAIDIPLPRFVPLPDFMSPSRFWTSLALTKQQIDRLFRKL